jgi:hypothetical protein
MTPIKSPARYVFGNGDDQAGWICRLLFANRI